MSNEYNPDIDQKLVNDFQDVIVEIFQLLESFGIKELHVGGLMRLLGVSEDVAKLYDNQILVADDLQNYSEYEFTDMPEPTIVNGSNNKLH